MEQGEQGNYDRPAADPDDPEDFGVTKEAVERTVAKRRERLQRLRGAQRTPTRKQVTLRLDPDVLAKFRAIGPGRQSRIDAALRAAEI